MYRLCPDHPDIVRDGYVAPCKSQFDDFAELSEEETIRILERRDAGERNHND